MRLTVLLNERAGSIDGSADEQARRVYAAFEAAGVTPELCFVNPQQLAEAGHKAAVRSEVVVAAGGDGTLQSVAKGVLGTDAAFAVLPLGTYNHLAKELAMPLEIEAAAQAIARGQRQHFTVPMLNGQLFLSFAAIGLYARAIRHRDAQRKARDRSKTVGMLIAMLRILRRPPYRRIRLEIGDRVLRRFSSSLFVVCNEYQLDALGRKDLHGLDRSLLNVCVARAWSRWQVIKLVVLASLGRISNVMEVLTAPSLSVYTHHRQEPVVLDGELATMDVPLRFEISSTPLTFIVPPKELREEANQMLISRH